MSSLEIVKEVAPRETVDGRVGGGRPSIIIIITTATIVNQIIIIVIINASGSAIAFSSCEERMELAIGAGGAAKARPVERGGKARDVEVDFAGLTSSREGGGG